MKILITGICGFVGYSLAVYLSERIRGSQVIGLDNFIRPGSELNRAALRRRGIRVLHGDIRVASDFEGLPQVDWVIDAAANPSVLAGVDGRSSSRQLVEHNFQGTLNIVEYCKGVKAGLILLSTSRVYSIPGLQELHYENRDEAYVPSSDQVFPGGVTVAGISETYSTRSPVSLYGATKVASESLALDYGFAFGFPVWINRCGVLAGGGQFGRADQGIFSFWIHSWKAERPMAYFGFNGEGHQVRDCLHPEDLGALILKQLQAGSQSGKPPVVNVGGGVGSSRSLKQLSDWCRDRFGDRKVHARPEPRLFDLPWVVLDSGLAREVWDWAPRRTTNSVLEEIARHAELNPEWLDLTSPS